MDTINKRINNKLLTETSVWNTKQVSLENNYEKFIKIKYRYFYFQINVSKNIYPFSYRSFQFVSETTWKLILKTNQIPNRFDVNKYVRSQNWT